MPNPLQRRRPRGDSRYIFYEKFSGNVVGSDWTVVDTASHMSVANGLLSWDGGKAVPTHGDPMAERTQPIVRKAGLMFVAKVRAGTINALGPSLVIANAVPYTTIATQEEYSLGLSATGYLACGRLNASLAALKAYSAATWVWLCAICRATGADLFYSLDGSSFYRLFNYPLGTTSPLYALLETYSQAGDADSVYARYGTVPSAILSATPAAPTVTYGGEIITNRTFDGNSTANWTTTGTGLISAASNRLTIDRNGGAYGSAGTPTDVISVGSWYQLGFDIVALTNQFDTGSVQYTTTGTKLSIMRATQAFLILYPAASSVATATLDNFTCKNLAPASILGLVGDAHVKAALYERQVTCAAGYQSGFACCLSDETNPTYMLYCWVDRTAGTVNLANRVNDVEAAALISTATGVTYAAGRKPRVVIVPVAGSSTQFTIAVSYESAAGVFTTIGTTQTLDLSAHGTKVANFDTDPATATASLTEVWGGMTL